MIQKKNLFFFLFVSVFILVGQETNLQDAEQKIRTLAKACGELWIKNQ